MNHLQEALDTKDGEFKQLQQELLKYEISKEREGHQARIILLSEALSMKIFAAIESRQLPNNSGDEDKDNAALHQHRENVIIALLDHCCLLMKFTATYLKLPQLNGYSKPLEAGNNLVNANSEPYQNLLANLGSIDKSGVKLTQKDVEVLRNGLLQTKTVFDEAVAESLHSAGITDCEGTVFLL